MITSNQTIAIKCSPSSKLGHINYQEAASPTPPGNSNFARHPKEQPLIQNYACFLKQTLFLKHNFQVMHKNQTEPASLGCSVIVIDFNRAEIKCIYSTVATR